MKTFKQKIKDWVENESWKISLSDERTVEKAIDQILEVVEKDIEEKFLDRGDRIGFFKTQTIKALKEAKVLDEIRGWKIPCMFNEDLTPVERLIKKWQEKIK